MLNLAAVLTVGGLLSASTPPVPSPGLQNGDFEAGRPGEFPPGWSERGLMRDAGYRVELTRDTPHEGQSAVRLWRDKTVPVRPNSFGSLAQAVDVTALRGHRIRYSAAVKVVPGGDRVGLWLRVDGADGKPAFFDNMANRPITASTWAVHSIEAYVAPDAANLVLGLLLAGGGEAAMDSAILTDLGPADPEPSDEAKAYLDRALKLLATHHINGADADWPSITAQAYGAAAGATQPGHTYPAIQLVIKALGERHTFLSTPERMKAIVASRATAPLPTGRISGDIGFVALPAIATEAGNPKDDGEPYRQAIETVLKDGDAKAVCGWVIDLTSHTGGNMYPGLRGLAPLLGGDEPLGAFVGRSGRKPWESAARIARFKMSKTDAPLAVILGPRTASAGEAIAIGMLGRPTTRTFGQPSAGLTTGNAGFPLGDGAYLIITTVHEEDRTGHRYEGRIVPDETVPLDKAEAAAMAWLKSQGCRGSVSPIS